MRSLKIVIFERTAQNRGEIEFIHDKLSAGFSVSGDRVEISSATYVPCDVAVIMWSPRVGWPDRARAARAVRNLHGGNLLIIETPLLRNVAEWHYRVGFDHVHRAGKFFAPKMPNDRAAAMNLVLAPWKSSEGAIVIAGQLPGDYSLDGTDISEWVVDVATHIERSSRRKVVIRPHPFDVYTNWQQVKSSLGVEISRESLDADLARAGTWVAYTSGSAVDAAIAGVPVICLNSGNFAWEVASHSLSGLEKPWLGDRSQWLANLAYTQWTSDEIGNGLCWLNLRGLREVRSWKIEGAAPSNPAGDQVDDFAVVPDGESTAASKCSPYDGQSKSEWKPCCARG